MKRINLISISHVCNWNFSSSSFSLIPLPHPSSVTQRLSATYARTSSGQMTVKVDPRLGRAYDFDSASEQIDQSLGDGQAKPRAAAVVRACDVDLPELFEDERHLFVFHPYARVRDFDVPHLPRIAHRPLSSRCRPRA